MNKLHGILAYVQVQKPVKCFDESKGEEFKASIIMTDKEQALAFKAYSKGLKCKTTAKEVSEDDFEAMFKLPFPEEANGKVWVVTFRRNTMLGGTGKPLEPANQPKALINLGSNRYQNITKKKLIANGSKGFLSFITYTSKKGDTAFYLENVVVNSPEDLIEYVTQVKANASLGEGAEILDDDTEIETVVTKTESKPKAKPVKAQEIDDEDDPF